MIGFRCSRGHLFSLSDAIERESRIGVVTMIETCCPQCDCPDLESVHLCDRCHECEAVEERDHCLSCMLDRDREQRSSRADELTRTLIQIARSPWEVT